MSFLRRRTPMMLCLLLLLVALTGGECEEEVQWEWQVVWRDEFNGPAAQLPDSTKWRFDIGTDWGNQQLEYDTDRAENVSLDGSGNLAITARIESYQGSAYTSGRIKTRGLFSRQYGRFAARVLLPVGQGIWPAFWMLGADFPDVPWPDCGEIDIMEYRGQEPSVVIGSAHGPGYSGGAAISRRYRFPSGNLNERYHVYAIEWDSDGIKWFIDDTQYHHVTRGDLPQGESWVYDHPFFILLNVAVGGRFVGPPNGQTAFPQTMKVDWVRVYEFGPPR